MERCTLPNTDDDHTAEHHAAIAERLGDLARFLYRQDDVGDTLQAIVDTAVTTVPGAVYAGVSVSDRRQSMRTPAATADLVQHVDTAQVEQHEGPCLDALYEEHVVSLPDTGDNQRWPSFAARAASLGIGSMLSFQLYVEQDGLGALNLYSPAARAFDAESEHVGRLFAAHAAVAFASARQITQLGRAVDTRDVIGQAKGILMERHRITADQAFAVLLRASQDTHLRLADIAEYLTRSGELPHTD